MTEVVGVRFKKAGKIYYFDPGKEKIESGAHVIVETVRGIEYGTVVHGNKAVNENNLVSPLKTVIRVATPKDDDIYANNKIKEKEAFEICLKKIAEKNMDMKLIDTEMTFDRNKLIFYFTSDGRVDFRELVKDLAAIFKTRIELRQIGVRDEAKMLNCIGICGRSLCCSTFLGDFHPVSIKMAKEQNLSLNPTKISGVCGRLMCCLKYEEDVYEELNKNMPNVGDTIKSEDGTGEILSTNVLMQQVKAAVKKNPNDAPTIKVYPISEIKVIKRKKGKKAKDIPEPDLSYEDDY
ncbi:MAG: stage 0 sporulation family protein [Firmicutes bacterium]|nr:stage 0 sporulation family protein [Bacillota bacterium]